MPRNSNKPKSTRSVSKSPTTITKEVKCLAAIAGGILLLIAVFVPAEAGGIGRLFNNILIGLLGFGGILLPIGLIAIAGVNLFSKQIRIPVVHSVILFLLVLSWVHVITFPFGGEAYTYYSRMQLLGYVFTSRRMLGGGLVGAALGNLIRMMFGHWGAIILLSTASLIILVLMTKRSFVGLVEKGVNKVKVAYNERSRFIEEDEDDDDEAVELVRPQAKPKKGQGAGAVPARRGEPARRKEASPMPSHLAEIMEIDPDDIDDEEHVIRLVHEEIGQEPAISSEKIAPFVERHRNWPPKDQESELEPEPNAYYDDYEDDVEINAHNHGEYEEIPEYESNLVVRGLVDDAAPTPSYEHIEEYDHGFNDGYPAPQPQLSDEPPAEHTYEDFELPPINILARNEKPQSNAESRTQVMKNSRILEETLRSFRVEAEVVEVSVGPTVTRYDLAPAPGVKVSSIVNLSNDLALSLAAQGIRIEAPIPGKAAVGIEIPNKEPQGVYLREIIEGERFETFHSKLAFAVGKDIAGNPVVADVADMPHLLIAGATGAGKSVCINTLIASILYKAKPDEVKLLMVDPKVVELSVYNGIPHLLIPVVTDPKKASGALNWAVQEMESRYNSFAETGCRDLKGYNKFVANEGQPELPQIVIIIDELADLMMTCKGEVEEAICRLAQKARAAGIHLIVATQRPSVDVITGLIKANIPSRLAFAVSSGTDSRTVLDMQGAEKLLGRGDMLFLPRGQNKPIRVQGGFISDKEVEQLVAFLKAQAPVAHTTEMIQQITMPGKTKVEGEVDEFFYDAVEFLLVKGKASTSMLQRQFRIGYNRASRLMEDLEIRGIVGPEDGVKPRKVTITREEYAEIYDR